MWSKCSQKGGTSDRITVAALIDDDRVWALPLWKRFLPELCERHRVQGIWIVRGVGKPVGRKGGAFWMAKVFGLGSAMILGLFAARRRLLVGTSWKRISVENGVPLFFTPSANTNEVSAWISENEIDVVLLMTTEILKGKILSATRFGIINNHASVLPAARGVYPFFWSVIENLPLGLSFHLVDEGIDSGPLVAQRIFESRIRELSMLAFYRAIFRLYPELALEAIETASQGRTLSTRFTLPSDYFGFPQKADSMKFTEMGGMIARFSDLYSKPPKLKEV